MIVSACDFAWYRADYCEAPTSIKILDSTKEESPRTVIFSEATEGPLAETAAIDSATLKILQASICSRYQLDKAKMTVF